MTEMTDFLGQNTPSYIVRGETEEERQIDYLDKRNIPDQAPFTDPQPDSLPHLAGPLPEAVVDITKRTQLIHQGIVQDQSRAQVDTKTKEEGQRENFAGEISNNSADLNLNYPEGQNLGQIDLNSEDDGFKALPFEGELEPEQNPDSRDQKILELQKEIELLKIQLSGRDQQIESLKTERDQKYKGYDQKIVSLRQDNDSLNKVIGVLSEKQKREEECFEE